MIFKILKFWKLKKKIQTKGAAGLAGFFVEYINRNSFNVNQSVGDRLDEPYEYGIEIRSG